MIPYLYLDSWQEKNASKQQHNCWMNSLSDFLHTPPKTNSWNLKIPPKGKGDNIDPKSPLLGSNY